jgi:protein-L-isoaspartate(D-aspartate) O-methyltransferase
LYHGDGFAGLPKFAPFKGILITCGAPDVPAALLEQLAIGGKLVIPVGIETQTMLVVERVGQEEFRTTEHGEFKFVPMLGGTEN